MMVNACALVTHCAVEVCSFREGVERSVTGNLDPQDILISKMLRLDARQKTLLHGKLNCSTIELNPNKFWA